VDWVLGRDMAAKSERELMLAGEMYLASDPELVDARRRARRLTRLFNQSTEEEVELRRRLIGELFGAVGARFEIEPSFRCDYGFNIFAGDNLFVNFGAVFLDCAPIRIGRNAFLAPGVHLYTATHPTDAATRVAGREYALPITIGDDAWLGGRVIVCPGVTIGDRCVIGAGSVVTKNIPAGVVAAGNPCRVIRDA
jgi:maltose O-acetyltransferase